MAVALIPLTSIVTATEPGEPISRLTHFIDLSRGAIVKITRRQIPEAASAAAGLNRSKANQRDQWTRYGSGCVEPEERANRPSASCSGTFRPAGGRDARAEMSNFHIGPHFEFWWNESFQLEKRNLTQRISLMFPRESRSCSDVEGGATTQTGPNWSLSGAVLLLEAMFGLMQLIFLFDKVLTLKNTF